MTIHIIEKDEREEKFAALRKLGVELSVPVPELFVSRKIENPGCETIIKEGRSHTWVRNFYNLLFITSIDSRSVGYGDNYGAGYLTPRKFGNGAYIDYPDKDYLVYMVNSSNYPDLSGIVCGTGDTAYSFEQYQLVSKISHGSTEGQFSHVNMIRQTPTYDSGTKTWSCNYVRQFNNNSGAAIDVKELGIASYSPSNYYGCLLARDVLGSTDTINIGGQYTVTYTVKLTFPA